MFRFLAQSTWVLAFFFFISLTAQTFSTSSIGAAEASRPNIVLILTDDQGWGDLAVHGNDRISTPTLDAFADQSVRLNQFYVSPVCAPTRAALLTGRYPERTGVAGVTSRREVMRSDEVTIAEVFRDAGYATGCFGKWHNGAQMPLHPNGQGFDQFFGFCGGHFNLYDNPLLERNGIPVETKGYITDILTDEACKFIRAESDNPFFCYVPFNAPHGPFQVQQNLFDKYNDGTIDEKTAAVYAMVENIDSNVRRLLQTLDAQGIAENTIVLFLTDNGPNGKRFNGGMKGAKGSVHEGGCRVPCFIRWPEKIKPGVIDQITAHIDVLPTVMQWCGIQQSFKSPLDGRSLARLVDQGFDEQLAGRSIITYRPNQLHLDKFGKGAVRTQTHRFTVEKGDAALYDMVADPGQRNDIASEQPKLTQQLQSELQKYVSDITPSITSQRRVPVSPERPTFAPSVDAMLEGSPGFADGISWAHSWVDQWKSPEDRVRWPLEFLEEGRYHVSIHYVTDAKATAIKATVGDQTMTETIPRFSQKSQQRPDLDSKSTPRRMLSFREHSLGTFTVPKGSARFQLERTGTEGAMIELGGITITKCDLPPKGQFQLFLLAGQSNMAGRGKVTKADKVPDSGVLMLDRKGRWVPAKDPVHFDKRVAGVGPAREFARTLQAKNPSIKIGLVPCAVGGSPIASWAPGGFHKETKTHPYDDAEKRITTAMESGVFRGIIWHQGESDSNPTSATTYQESLLAVLKRLRSLVGEQTPIVIGQLAHRPDQPWTESRKIVDQAHRAVAQELSNAAFVVSDELTLKSDNIHFDRESMMEFGRRYAEAFLKLDAGQP